MSDFDIDLAVFQAKFGPIGSDKDMWRVWKQGKFRPCEHWADAGPIIADYGITLVRLVNNSWVSVSTYVYEDTPRHTACDKSPLRAAMIVFLKSQEKK